MRDVGGKGAGQGDDFGSQPGCVADCEILRENRQGLFQQGAALMGNPGVSRSHVRIPEGRMQRGKLDDGRTQQLGAGACELVSLCRGGAIAEQQGKIHFVFGKFGEVAMRS